MDDATLYGVSYGYNTGSLLYAFAKAPAKVRQRLKLVVCHVNYLPAAVVNTRAMGFRSLLMPTWKSNAMWPPTGSIALRECSESEKAGDASATGWKWW
ncbi:hypothetical protein BDW67DRAFT_183236 [Aspergillus spinulosporus]